jgi:hypothetical protein
MLLVTCFLSVSLAAPPIRHDARMVIEKTAVVLVEAQRAANHGHKYFGLGNAIAHQRVARDLFMDGHFKEAMHHSFRARALAAKVIEINHGRLIQETRREDWEERYARQAPSDDELDLKIGDRKVRDEDAVSFKIDLHIRE